jgi:hypothetical protein
MGAERTEVYILYCENNFTLQYGNQARHAFLSFSVVVYNGGHICTKLLISYEIIFSSWKIPSAVQCEI